MPMMMMNLIISAHLYASKNAPAMGCSVKSMSDLRFHGGEDDVLLLGYDAV
jgi:hypothetical protein